MKNTLKMLFLCPIILSCSACNSNSEEVSFNFERLSYKSLYDDCYFSLDNSQYHEEIAEISAALEMTCFNYQDDVSKRKIEPTRLWKKIGYENIYFSESMTQDPTVDSIGYCFASKEIDDFTVISVLVRGTYYKAEWVSNVTIGETGNAQGFESASQQLYAGLKTYIKDYNFSGKVKFWMTSYSRGAATVNLTAAKILDDPFTTVAYDENDMYAYCFETPLCAMDIQNLSEEQKNKYKGIHNFMNYNDVVTLVAPSSWGFRRYGVEHYYPDRLTDIYFDEKDRETMVKSFHFMRNSKDKADYNVDRWKFFNPGEVNGSFTIPVESIHQSMGRSFRTLIDCLSGGIDLGVPNIGRSKYAESCQEGLGEFFCIIQGVNENIQGINISNILPLLFEKPLYNTLSQALQEGRVDDFMMDCGSLFEVMFVHEDGSTDEAKQIYNHNSYFLNTLANVFTIRKDLGIQFFYRDNLLMAMETHAMNLSYSFVRTCDTRLYKDKACSLNDGSYYVLKVNEPTNFEIFEKNLNKTIFTYEDEIMSTNVLAAEKNSDGSLNIYLPKNGEYEYKGNFSSASLYNEHPVERQTLLSDNLPSEGNI